MKKKFLTCMVALCLLVSGSVLLASCGSEDTVTSVSTEAELIEAFAKGGSVSLTEDIAVNDTLVVSSGKSVKLDLNGNSIKLYTAEAGTESVSDMTTIIYVYGNLTITDSSANAEGSIVSSKGDCCVVSVDGGTFTLKSGKLESQKYYAIYCLNSGTAIIDGGTVKAYYAAISGNNTTGDMNFVINGGTISSDVCEAIYMPGQVSLTMTGGTLNGGISARMGQIKITGGTVNAMTTATDAIESYWNYSGSAWIGNAIYVMAGTYTSSNSTYDNTCNIEIGGTAVINGLSHDAIVVYNIGNNNTQNVNISITGGTITSTNGSTIKVVDVSKLENLKEISGKKAGIYEVTTTITITGGSFSDNAGSNYVDTQNGYSMTQETSGTDQYYVVSKQN